MPVARCRPRGLRPFVSGLVVAVTVPVLGWSAPAAADDEVVEGATVVGEFVQAWQEFEDEDTAVERADGALLSYVRSEDGDSVRLDSGDVGGLPVGATVEVTVGRTVTDEAATEDGLDRAREVLAAEVVAAAPTAAAGTGLDHEVTVVMVTPAGGVQDGTTLQQVVDAVDGPVADFWAEQAGRRVGVVAAYDWMTTTAGCSDPFGLWDEVADRVGFVPTARQHLLLYVTSAPSGLNCSYGLGTVGSSALAGGYAYVRGTATSVIAHELGHNFSLGHSSARQCDRAVESGTCRTESYADYYDVMGYSWSQVGSLSMAQASRLGHVPSADVRTIYPESLAQTVTLAPVSQLSGLRAIQLRGASGRVYWLEYRPASGRDAWIPGAGFQAGVQLRNVPGSGPDYSLLLDATPSPQTGWAGDRQPALPLNTPVGLSNGDFTVTVESTTASGATIRVTTPTVVSPIDVAHAASGGDAGVLGPATAVETCVDVGGVRRCSRTYQAGAIHWSAATGAHSVYGALYPAWVASGGIDRWGLPTTDTVCGLAAGGCTQDFASTDGLTATWSPATGLQPVAGAVRGLWRSIGGVVSPLAYPTGPDACSAGTCEQSFQGGAVVSTAARGAIAVQGLVHQAWAAAGGRSGPLGVPVSGLRCRLVRDGCGQQFAGGSVYWSAATGAHTVTGSVRDRWGALGWENGLGYPVTDTQCGLAGGGCGQRFEHGWLYGSASTPVRSVVGSIGQVWDASGRQAGALGYPLTDEVCGLNRGGCLQMYQQGSIYWSPQTGAHVVSGSVRDRWAALGAQNGGLGYPLSDTDCSLPGGGCTQRFQGGWLSGSTATGVRTVYGSIGQAWVSTGRETGTLGLPLMDEYCGLIRGGCFQQFQQGSVYWSMSTGAQLVSGAIRERWGASGWETGRLGYPVTSTYCGLRDGGCAQVFQGGSVYSSASSPASVVTGLFRDAWGATGFEGGVLGYPVGDQWCGIRAGGCFQHFQNGSLYWSSATGVHVVRGAVRDRWAALGWENSTLGYPVSDTYCSLPNGGCAQVFQGGSVYSSATTPASVVTGAFRDRWGVTGFEGGVLGYPTGDQYCGIRDGGCFQPFQGGAMYWSPATGVRVVAGTVYARWRDLGYEVGPLGFPLSDTSCGLVGGGCFQHFQGGSLYASASTPVVTVAGAIRDAWAASGWEVGRLGYPTADPVCDTAGCTQVFQRGTIGWSAATGARVAAGVPAPAVSAPAD